MDNYLIVTLAFLAWRVLRLSRKHKWRSSIRHELGLALFAAFCVWLFTVTVGFPQQWHLDMPKRYNFVPFEVVRRSLNDWNHNGSLDYFLSNLVGNVAVFIPVGFMIYLLWHASGINTLLCGFCVSLAIECAQFPIGRWTDVDDLILNTLGTAIGLLLSFGMHRIAARFCDGFKCR